MTSVNSISSGLKLASIFLIWLVYSSAYLVFVNVNATLLAGYLALVGQVGLDIIISIYTFKLSQITDKYNLKFIYFLFFLSTIAAVVADCTYHTAMNILDANYFNKVNSFFEIPFI